MYRFIKFIPEFVDLGLPSGLKWAKCNVGAFAETEDGKYFQWGDVEGRYADEIKKKPCNWDTTPWGRNNPPIQTLDSEHDAATAAYGEEYRMPTFEDFRELYIYTINEWVENYKGSGVNGALFTSRKNVNSIFIPASGYANNDSINSRGAIGDVWSSSLSSIYHNNALYLFFNSSGASVGNSGRCYGHSVRAVTK